MKAKQIRIERITSNIKNLLFKFDLVNNSNNKIIDYCDHFNFDSNLLLSLKNSFEFKYIWVFTNGLVMGYIDKDDNFIRTNDGGNEKIINKFENISIDSTKIDTDVRFFIWRIKADFDMLLDNDYENILLEFNSFSFNDENDVVDDNIDEKTNVDMILEKVSKFGIDKLTIREKNILDNYSKSL